jgi:hypothetical protein
MYPINHLLKRNVDFLGSVTLVKSRVAGHENLKIVKN